jgi:hypothetical protein
MWYNIQMGLMDKKVGDVTIGEVAGAALLFWWVKHVIDWLSEPSKPPIDKRLPVGHPDRVNREIHPESPAKASLINSLREMKELGLTPAGGWDEWREFSPYVEDVRVQPGSMNNTLDWPDWMLAPPAVPRDRRGNIVA